MNPPPPPPPPPPRPAAPPRHGGGSSNSSKSSFSLFQRKAPSQPAAGAAQASASASAGATTTEQERREQRLAKNRESARQSRRRKKENLELLQERMGQLSVQLDDLRNQQAQAGAAATAPLQGDEPRTLARFSFARLRRLLLPPHARFWLWLHRQKESDLYAECTGAGSSTSASKVGERLMTQQQEQPQPAAGGGGWEAGDGRALWPLLCFEVQFKGEQEERARTLFKGHRNALMSSGELQALVGMATATDVLEMDVSAVQAKLSAVRQVLSPAQWQVLERHVAAAAQVRME